MADPIRTRQGFLGRLAQLPRGQASPRERALAEIVRNLGFVLNTRKACGSVLVELGLGDYEVDVNTHRAVETLRGELVTAVRRFEPRIAAPAVRLLGRYRYSMVRFALAGAVDGEPCTLDIDIDTTTQRVDVRVAQAGRR